VIDFNTVPDKDLYEMCMNGDEGAWQYMYNFILTICKWGKWNLRDEPEDLAQEITTYLIEKAFKKVSNKHKFKNFVKIMTINKIKDSFKIPKMQSIDKPIRNKRGEEFTPEYADPGPLQDSFIFNLQVVSIIDTAVRKLSQDCQKIITEYLKFKTGSYKDYKELSKVLRMSVPTISSSVRRCLNKLVEVKEVKSLKQTWRPS
jgi:RNA polymerase sigma factor (sigma-70 family)